MNARLAGTFQLVGFTFLAWAISSVGAAQTVEPWSVHVATDRASAIQNGLASPWTTDRFGISWVRSETGGWFAGLERHARGGRVDLTPYTRGYRRLGDWTFLAGAAGTPRADFQYQASLESEVSRVVVGALVASAGYRWLMFPGGVVHLVQPAMTWYYPKGELQGRVFVSRSGLTGRSSSTVLLQAVHDIKTRVRAGGGLAYGDRVFDVASLPTSSARTQLAFGHLRLGITLRDAIEIGTTFAHEEPSFDYRSVSLGYRRAF